MPELSVIVITKNEEENLPGFLSSFLQVADEIVIIDDGSSDRTDEIARSADSRVRFYSEPRRPNEGFCDQRQKGLNRACGDWILQVDADMRLTPELAMELPRAIRSGNFMAYRFRLRQYWMNHAVRFGGFQYWNQAWLAHKKVIVGWSQRVHERLELDVKSDKIGSLSARMIHLNDISFRDRLRKNHQYSELEVDRMLMQGETFSTYKLVTVPIWRFLRSYVLMLGVLDGRVGLVWAMYQFCGTATVYFLGWSMVHGGSRKDIESISKLH